MNELIKNFTCRQHHLRKTLCFRKTLHSQITVFANDQSSSAIELVAHETFSRLDWLYTFNSLKNVEQANETKFHRLISHISSRRESFDDQELIDVKTFFEFNESFIRKRARTTMFESDVIISRSLSRRFVQRHKRATSRFFSSWHEILKSSISHTWINRFVRARILDFNFKA